MTVTEIAQQGRPNRMAEALARGISPIDWGVFWDTDAPPEEWIVEPIVPARRQVAIYSPAKSGKSLLALEIAAGRAAGRSVLGQPASAPVPVVYFDFEMTEDDVRERLIDLGYGPDDDLSRLAYYQLPTLPPLDTERGGQVLEELVGRHAPVLAVLDTMARVVQGDEDQADTYRGFYAHSGVRLKRLGVSLLRLDHAGKDLTRGQRGSSAKADDVDVVFRLSVSEDKVILTRTHSRVPWVPSEIALERQVDPVLRHVLVAGGWPTGTSETARLLDELDIPLDATVRTAQQALRRAGKGRRQVLVRAGLRWRKERSGCIPQIADTPSDALYPDTPAATTDESASAQVTGVSAYPGYTGIHGHGEAGYVCPSLEGHVPDTGLGDVPPITDDDIARLMADDDGGEWG